MLRASLCGCAAGVLSVLTVAASPAPSAAALVVRAYNSYGVPAHELDSAVRTVDGLLGSIAIRARWRNCRVVGRSSPDAVDDCAEPVAANELIVRVVRALRPFDGVAALGFSFIDPVRRSGTLATIYADRVAALSRALEVDGGTMLGRAVAHEIGHLLLGSERHAPVGLMRGRWSRHLIVDNSVDDWVFTAQQGLDMQSALTARVLLAEARPATR